MKKRLIKALCYVPEGQYVSLGDDTFLTGYLMVLRRFMDLADWMADWLL